VSSIYAIEGDTMRFAALLAVLLSTSSYAGPAEAVSLAAANTRTIPDATQYRFMTTDGMRPKELESFQRALNFHINSLSREADFAAPLPVAPGLYRVNLVDYQWDAKTWEKLADVEPYFHVTVAAETIEYEEYGHYYVNGREAKKDDPGAVWKTEEKRPVKRQSKQARAAAPWLPAKDISYLIDRTQSQCPIVRADWFLAQTAISEGKNPGYVDFLGYKNRAEFEKISGLDAELSKRLQKEIRDALAESGVAANNRGFVRLQTITGCYWITLDSFKNTDKNNAIRRLDADLEHDAEEIYAVLPNSLFVVGAFNAKDGTLQKTVPDTIASADDLVALGNDHRIHTGGSCFFCHAEGIRPFKGDIRTQYRGFIQLQVVDYKQFRRLSRLYLSDSIQEAIAADQTVYAKALNRCNGLTPEANAAGYLKAYRNYANRSLLPEDFAREWGYTTDDLLARLRFYASPQGAGQLDPILSRLIQNPPVPVRREQAEEVQPLLYAALKGVKLTP
jgi:hypothetical protein